jgi:hypothetical protein
MSTLVASCSAFDLQMAHYLRSGLFYTHQSTNPLPLFDDGKVHTLQGPGLRRSSLKKNVNLLSEKSSR